MLLLAAVFVCTASFPAWSASGKPASGLQLGAGKVAFGKISLLGDRLHLYQGVQLTSEQYDLTAEDVNALLGAAKGGPKRVTATGSLAKKTQVDAHIRQDLSGEAFEIFADKAVYVPEAARPGGGRIDFTGHVKVIWQSAFLAEPSVSTFEDGQPVTVLLGQGADYPQLEAGPGQIIATPAK